MNWCTSLITFRYIHGIDTVDMYNTRFIHTPVYIKNGHGQFCLISSLIWLFLDCEKKPELTPEVNKEKKKNSTQKGPRLPHMGVESRTFWLWGDRDTPLSHWAVLGTDTGDQNTNTCTNILRLHNFGHIMFFTSYILVIKKAQQN